MTTVISVKTGADHPSALSTRAPIYWCFDNLTAPARVTGFGKSVRVWKRWTHKLQRSTHNMGIKLPSGDCIWYSIFEFESLEDEILFRLRWGQAELPQRFQRHNLKSI